MQPLQCNVHQARTWVHNNEFPNWVELEICFYCKLLIISAKSFLMMPVCKISCVCGLKGRWNEEKLEKCHYAKPTEYWSELTVTAVFLGSVCQCAEEKLHQKCLPLLYWQTPATLIHSCYSILLQGYCRLAGAGTLVRVCISLMKRSRKLSLSKRFTKSIRKRNIQPV